ncbi:hypothetical protein GX51_03320 [Blastomyces parvus]|uniref:Myb-like domain-containing protein n=1 Tax=Blastomyces parvus TaxID=2060905 RepID=A0A2B7X7S8_9EURO|nr:hypothetical protein GX51_03320 [Blastomyces parvus]
MDSLTGMYTIPTADDPFNQLRDLPQPNNLRIPPLRDPIPSRSLKAPSPLEPNAGGTRETTNISKTSLISGNLPAKLPTLEDFLHAARASNSGSDTTYGKVSSADPPPRTILPTFINLRAIEKLPYASFDEDAPRKPRRPDLSGDVFGEHLQLPIPKNQKETPKRPPFGPLTILNGLNEPPPNAALFPPIEPNAAPTILTGPTRDTPVPQDITIGSGTNERRGGRINDIIELSIEESIGEIEESFTEQGDHLTLAEQDVSKETGEDSDKEPVSPKPKTRSRKKLRKWTEEETRDLLRGVVKCGVGNWTAILAQPELKFNERTAANLKDRFRVCCPWAYGSEQHTLETVATSLKDSSNGPQASLSGKILLPDPRTNRNKQEPDASSTASVLKPASQTTNIVHSRPESPPARSSIDGTLNLASPKSPERKRPRSSTHTTNQSLSSKSRSTLMSLGLQEPCQTIKSNRRSRRPFTPTEDDALLKGHAVHGFQWTLIRQDKRLNLMHRKATDLRDRFRTKFPNVYREGGSVAAKKDTVGNNDSSTAEPRSAPDRDTPTISMLLSGNQSKTTPTRIQSDTADTGSGKRLTSPSPSNDVGSTSATDPIMLPPPPSALPDLPSIANTSLFTFQMDDGGSGCVDGSSWGDNTLPPLVWDELT